MVGYNVTYDATAHTATGTATGVFSEPLAGLDLSATTHTDDGSYTDTWTFTDVTGNYNNDSGTVSSSIAKATQTISWANPAAITYGTALSATQLNATVAGVANGTAPGALTYAPIAGTVLHAGPGQALTVTAAETSNYNPASRTVYIDVNKAALSVTAENQAKTYDATAFTVAYAGFVNGDTPASLNGTLSYNGTAVGAVGLSQRAGERTVLERTKEG